jgi:hypothetical protein
MRPVRARVFDSFRQLPAREVEQGRHGLRLDAERGGDQFGRGADAVEPERDRIGERKLADLLVRSHMSKRIDADETCRQ